MRRSEVRSRRRAEGDDYRRFLGLCEDGEAVRLRRPCLCVLDTGTTGLTMSDSLLGNGFGGTDEPCRSRPSSTWTFFWKRRAAARFRWGRTTGAARSFRSS